MKFQFLPITIVRPLSPLPGASWLVGWLAGWLAGFRPNSHSCPWRQYLWMNQEAFLSHCVSPSSIRWRTSNINIPVYHLLPSLNLRASLPNIEIRSVGRWTGMRMTRCAPNVIPLLRNIVLLTYFLPAPTTSSLAKHQDINHSAISWHSV